MHYYYFGFVQWASLTRLTGIVPEIAYNLAVPSIFALLCLNVWSAAVALISGIRREPGATEWRVPIYALLAPLFVAMLGNLDLVQRIGRGEFGYPANPVTILSRPGGFGDLLVGIWNATLHHPKAPPDIYWPSTRIIPGAINEFPAFTVLFADLHAHLMAMPLASAALVLACQIILRRHADVLASPLNLRGLRTSDLVARWGRAGAEGLAAGFLASALYATNTWDFPTYLALLIGAFAIRECVQARWALTYPLLLRIGFWAVGVVLAGRVLFWPFYASFYPQSGIVRQPDRTSVSAYLSIHGLFLLAIAGFVAMHLRLARIRPVPPTDCFRICSTSRVDRDSGQDPPSNDPAAATETSRCLSSRQSRRSRSRWLQPGLSRVVSASHWSGASGWSVSPPGTAGRTQFRSSCCCSRPRRSVLVSSQSSSH